MEISVVVPVYGCPSAIPELYARVVKTLETAGMEFELILVDDCDEMGSWDEVKKVASSDSRVKALHFTHNCGQDRAISAGVALAKGNWIVTMDCDLQDAPENILILYEKARNEKKDIIFVRRQSRKDSKSVQMLSKLFHKVFSYYTEIPFEYELGTYLIASKRAADQYRRVKDRGRDFTMFLMWLGYDHGFVEFEHEERYEGKSSYTFKKKFDYAVKMMTTFSNRILYLPVHIGLIAVVGSIIYIIIALVAYFFFHANPEGWTTLAVAVFLFGGLILSTLGIIGIYLGNVYDIDKDRPLYVVGESINCDENDDI